MPRKDKHSKGKEAAHADSWEEWSPWRWDDATQKWYQWRYDETGNVEHNSSTDQLDPRGDAAVEQMTAHLEQTHLSSASEGNENQAYNVYSTPDSSASHAYEQHIPGNPEHPYAPDAQQPVSDAGHAYGHAYEQSYEATYGQTPEAEQVSGLQDPQGSQALLNGDNDYGYDYSVAGIDAGPSYSQAPYDVYDQSHSAADPVSYYNESATPKSTAQRPRKKGREEYMDPQYSLVDSSEFRLGRIVKVWWPEGRGQRQNRQSTVNSRRNYSFDQLTYQGFRRFIIVGTRRGSCVIIPISTYGGQGCVKKGIHPEDHGIIHDHRWSPTPLPEEPQLGTGPVAAEMYGTEETLTDASRVNYAKVHNLEHNVPVWFVGELLPDALEMVQDAVRQRMHESTTGASMNHQRERSDRHRSSRDKSSRDKSDKHKKSKK